MQGMGQEDGLPKRDKLADLDLNDVDELQNMGNGASE
jgi:hypothetical protein